MIHFERWKILLIVLVCLWSVVYTLPNLASRQTVDWLEKNLPSWMPTKTVSLGLDLQGGSHLLLEVDVRSVLHERLTNMVDATRAELRQAQIGYVDLTADKETLSFSVRDPAQADAAREIVRKLDADVLASVEGAQIRARFTPEAVLARTRQAVDQSIEIIRRRIDETGTREPTIQRQGEDRVLLQLPGIDDPARVKRLLGQTAKLTFRFVDETATLADAQAGRLPPGSEILASADAAAGKYLVVKKRVMVSGDTLTDAQPSFQDGRPVVTFRLDSVGGRRFADATRDNVGRVFAIILDDKVISAPVIREPILGGAGQISGNFTVQSASDLALLLRAGALPAPLNVLEERSVGPGLGADSIEAGKLAGAGGLAMVVVFMLAAYGLFGLMANIALLFNITLILAVMSLLQATLTLPGIAGIVLTMGMAVDANVLIFERMREEIRLGRSVIAAVDAGYSRALSAIVDGNLTTLIAALLLYLFGSGPVRGFAVTLSIGITSSMFTAIMVTRLMVVLWLRRTRPKALPI